jgi:ABC-type polysaccharide/polyol phosphate transport system ATPase subunit
MSYIKLDHVSVNFPVFSSQSRGLINTLLRYSRSHQSRISRSGMGALQVQALRDISLNFHAGDRVGLVGHNGSGKTTLLRVLSGVYEPTAGSISLSGRVSALTDLMLGMDPEGSGYDFINSRGILLGLNRKQRNALIPDIEDFTELDEYLHLPVRTYSSGMLLRLAFATATVTVPDILLMDEMIGVGDARFLEKANRRLTMLMDKVHILVLASHNDQILRQFCNKAVLLSKGQVVFAGSVDEVIKMHHQI